MMKRIIKSIVLLLISLNMAGQLAPVTSQYVLNPLSINPAYAGNRGALNIAAFYRRQWAGIPGAPETMTLAADAPFLDYSYKIPMNKGNLSFGLGAGLMTTNTAWSDLVVLDPGDESFLSNSRVFVVPDFSFGVYYSYRNYFGGLSVPKLLGYRFNFDKNKYTILFNPGQYNYLLNAGYLYTISQKVKLLPSTLITLSPKEKILIDLNAYVSYNDRIWAGISYRNGRSLGALFQFAVNNQFRVAYTYDFDLGSLGRYSNGSHEIMLRYEFHYKVDAVSPLNF